MTFFGLLSKLKKESDAINKQNVTVILGINDIKKLCENKPGWDYVVIPLALKTSSTHNHPRKMWFVASNKQKRSVKRDQKTK